MADATDLKFVGGLNLRAGSSPASGPLAGFPQKPGRPRQKNFSVFGTAPPRFVAGESGLGHSFGIKFTSIS